MKKYVIGIDYGSLSARALLIDLSNGTEVAVSEFVYPHAVLQSDFFEGVELDKDSALQHPQDYLDALQFVFSDVLQKAEISGEAIVGIGIDFTSCTVLPVTKDGTPLCFLEEYKNEPHAYVKLWKHHSAQREADAILQIAKQQGETWLSVYGNKISSEGTFPKLLEILHKAPEIYEKTDRFLEAGDWLVWQLTGTEVHNSCMAGYKAYWDKKDGYPNNVFWGKVDPKFGNIIGTKIAENVRPTGTKAGELNAYGSELTGLPIGTAVTLPIIDAHAAVPSAGIVQPGKLMLILGTSACHIVLSNKETDVDGICGRVEDGIIPGYFAYEAGQSCMGDGYDWFIKNCIPEAYMAAARESGKNIFAFLSEKAAKKEIGEGGVIALDWWNGNRTPFNDGNLSGMLLGLTLQTKPEDIYRAMIESTAFGTKRIVELYEESGIAIDEVYAAGGISQKNPFLMQIYADVLGKAIRITESKQAGAKGSAVLAAVASGYFPTVEKAAAVIADKCVTIYSPNLENTKKYEPLYKAYKELSEYFGSGKSDIMRRLKAR